MLVQLARTVWPELRATWPITRIGTRSTMDRPRPSRPAQQDVDETAVLQHVPPCWSTRWSASTDETATGSRRAF
jgi:hypothetical protein